MKKTSTFNDIRLLIPMFLLNKLKVHPLTQGLYPVSLGKTNQQVHIETQAQSSQIYQLIYCQYGEGVLQYKNKQRSVKRGDLILISPNLAFQYQSKSDSKNTVYWLNFSGKLADDFAERLLMKMEDGFGVVGAQELAFKDFETLIQLGSRGYTATNVIHAVHVLQQMLSFLALQLRLESFNVHSTFSLEMIESLMQENLHQELNLDTLAHYSQLSKFHFAKKFKELTDTSPIQYFINMKIQHACFQLDNTEDTIKQIAESLGYSDPYYFSRLFKKMVGISPKQYRQS
ncbi:AraC family transcriptional regulator [Thalassotalea marina]|uniref:MmsAB operon regulatory protein n=1 Tax=Thalassotalea marina TaxID=1673741 RepID=A0A919BRK5_9GAMM|nr:AraC family transcriptional regulator [Thalassotalea marina]GHG06779.1 MmsAB operon regulatory protein [Thalassotalea marina]